MAKSPHTSEFRAKVSQEYLDGSSYPFLAKKYNIGKTTMRQWVASSLPAILLILQILKRGVLMRSCQGKEA